MNPKLCKRLIPCESVPSTSAFSSNEAKFFHRKTSSVRDEAALLVSFAAIAKSEIAANDGLLNTPSDDGMQLPHLPFLTEKAEVDCKWLTPRPQSLEDLLLATQNPTNRVRTVSFDNQKKLEDTDVDPREHSRTPSPTVMDQSNVPQVVTPLQSPLSIRRLPVRKQSLRLSTKARHESRKASEKQNTRSAPVAPAKEPTDRKSKALQGPCPKDAVIKRIVRRKFSWKNYPELEQFLVMNREEYLQHSALNYTVQQKQYNNMLTEKVLKLATQHGYVFDEKEFNFVTVRDRIRCYYKSYVQSAKKKGILMGYAARKAGLLSEDELEKIAQQDNQMKE